MKKLNKIMAGLMSVCLCVANLSATCISVSAETTGEIKQIPYEWYLEPSIQADDIIVSDDSFDVTKIDYDEKGSNKYSFIERDGKYNFISYDGNISLNKWYDEPRIAECGDLGVYNSDSSGIYYNMYDSSDFSKETNCWLNRGGASNVYYVYAYDRKTSEVYHPVEIGNPEHWGYECKYSCDYGTAILIQEADVKTGNYNWADINYNGKYGTAYDNKVTVYPEYDNGIMNVYNNMIALKSGDKWGYFNGKTGEQVIEFIADEIDSKYYCKSKSNFSVYTESRPYTYSDGYVSVNSDKGWALYDEEGNITIDYGTFDEIRPVHNGLAWVKYDGLWGVLDIEETIKSANTTTTTTTATTQTTTTPESTDTTTTTTIVTPLPTELESGDINGDNLIDAVDATAVSIEYANLATGGDSTLTDEQKKVADVNGDGLIDAVDSTYILRYYAKVSAGENIAFEEFVKNN
ncbi:MAG: WG repeat-containing protein [Ruminococcus sp.]|nr:WG repeat-containing protein [Ruminococcus sp.]